MDFKDPTLVSLEKSFTKFYMDARDCAYASGSNELSGIANAAETLLKGLSAYAFERDQAQRKIRAAQGDMMVAIQAFGGNPHDCLEHFNDAAYTAWLEAKSRLIESTRERDKMSDGAYQLAGKLTEIEEEHGRHVRLLATALKRYNLWPAVADE